MYVKKTVFLLTIVFGCQPLRAQIRLMLTAALIQDGYELRKKQYIDTMKRLVGFGYKDPYVVESVMKSQPTFLDQCSSNVFYAGTNDVRLKNKGVNEAHAMQAAFKHFKFNDDDMIIKITGRYYFSSRQFLDTVESRPDMDAFVKIEPCGNITTSCFALRCKFFKEMLDQIDYEKMERENTCIEKLVAEYIGKLYNQGKIKMITFNKLNLVAHVWGSGFGKTYLEYQ